MDPRLACTPATCMLLLVRHATDQPHPIGIRRESSRACIQLRGPRPVLCMREPLRPRGPPLPAPPSHAC
jgi:hypothetical protein